MLAVVADVVVVAVVVVRAVADACR